MLEGTVSTYYFYCDLRFEGVSMRDSAFLCGIKSLKLEFKYLTMSREVFAALILYSVG